MKRSTAMPYEGNEPYIFISYCHKDRRFVYPMIESLAQSGYRLWYDSGISAGSDWNEVIANHMSGSSICMAFISENAVASHNCRREISFALLKNKPLLSVFLEETALSPGMEMQLSAYQCVFAHTYADISKCLQVIMSASDLTSCLGVPDPTIEVRSPDFYDEPEWKNGGTSIPIPDVWFGVKASVEPTPEYVLVRQSTRELIALDIGDLCVGRVADSSQNSYAISGNPEISRKHFVITKQDGVYFVSDCRSKNRTFLNGTALLPNTPTKLNVGDEIRASTDATAEQFTFQIKPTGGDRLV